MSTQKKYINTLYKELSPYLLQHAKQPVAWQAWNENLFEEAEQAGKLIIISIGYSSCHWCHVMAHESFDDPEVARFMNAHFISIKVDREERPDVDRIYMQALQMLTGQGGWPLNIVALPNGQPIWGATYLPIEQWKNALDQLITLSKKRPEKLQEQAAMLIEGLQAINSHNEPQGIIPINEFNALLYRMLKQVDLDFGGRQGAPKFMMPVLLDFWLYASQVLQNKDAEKHVYNTLNKMAMGGVFDAIGGGFSRYAVDERWHVPHFEKMGYDNGQLLSTYSNAYRYNPNPHYKETVKNTIDFLESELQHPDGGFYAALDADSQNSEGKLEEGAYYVWNKKELQTLLDADFPLFQKYYNINSTGLWEGEKYVLFRTQEDTTFAQENGLSINTFQQKKAHWKTNLLKYRNQRKRPLCDDKAICSWNALICSGLLESYRVFREERYGNLAKKGISFIENHFLSKTEGLFRIYKNEQQTVLGLAEDFATLIQLYINAYELFFDSNYLLQAKKLMVFCIKNFSSVNSKLFSYTNRQQTPLLLQQIEIEDNVIPSSNALMAENLIRLSVHFDEQSWRKRAEEMIAEVYSSVSTYPSSHAKWLSVSLLLQQPQIEIVVTGKGFKKIMEQLQAFHLPHICWAGAATESTLPLLKERYVTDKTLVYWCEDQRCDLPETHVGNILKRLKSRIL